jgi:lycopene cyclase CruA
MSEFPRTRAALSDEAYAHVEALERGFAERTGCVIDGGGPDRGARVDFDVALAGGGLSLVYGAYLARAGLRVAIFDRRRIGCGHREWNISRAELAPLAAAGLFTAEEVDALVQLEYDHGVCRWHGGGTYPVRRVLDCVVDAERLLDGLRARAEAAGATLLDHHALAGYRVGPGGIEVQLAPAAAAPAPTQTLSARLLLDGMGAASPHAAFDLCCPTVGGVLGGLDRGDDALAVDERIGEILVTTEGIEDDRQHIWEGFPGPGGRFTAYLFYYTEPQHLPPHPLLSLYERFFATRARYKRGEATLHKATYGFIPAYSRLRPMPAARDRVLLVGDAAGRHSPLTFCGFGSMIRSFLPVADALVERLADDRLGARALAGVWREPPGLQVMGGLTLMMVPGRRPSADPAAVNQLLDAAFASLAELGDEVYGAFVRDQIGFSDFITFMRATARRRPSIYDEVFRQLSKGELVRWSLRLGRLALSMWPSGCRDPRTEPPGASPLRPTDAAPRSRRSAGRAARARRR